jgi:flagellar biosynthesis protein FlhG
MSADRHNDQADGLRRMFSPERLLRVIHVIAGCAGVGRLTVAVNLGLALAKAGRETLLIDVIENRQRQTALDRLALKPSARQAASGLSSVTGPHGLEILALDAAATQSPMRAAQIAGCSPGLSFALVTDSSTRCGRWLPIEDDRREFIVVLSRATPSITDAYALIKRLSAAGVCRRFHVLINRVASGAEAALIFRNMSAVARGYLDVELELLGFIPADPAHALAAAQHASLIDAAPEAPAAKAFIRLAHRIAALSQLAPLRDIAPRGRARAVGAA